MVGAYTLKLYERPAHAYSKDSTCEDLVVYEWQTTSMGCAQQQQEATTDEQHKHHVIKVR
jgi:hypothetical protein